MTLLITHHLTLMLLATVIIILVKVTLLTMTIVLNEVTYNPGNCNALGGLGTNKMPGPQAFY